MDLYTLPQPPSLPRRWWHLPPAGLRRTSLWGWWGHEPAAGPDAASRHTRNLPTDTSGLSCCCGRTGGEIKVRYETKTQLSTARGESEVSFDPHFSWEKDPRSFSFHHIRAQKKTKDNYGHASFNLHAGSGVCTSWSDHGCSRQRAARWGWGGPWPSHPDALPLPRSPCQLRRWFRSPSFAASGNQ